MARAAYGEKARNLVLADVSRAVSVEIGPCFLEPTCFFPREETKFAGSLVDKRKIFVDDGEKLTSDEMI
jgi:hypothetical protein